MKKRRWITRNQDGSDGFTILELLVAMLLLAIVLVGLAALQIATVRQVTTTRRANEATRLAQSMIELDQNRAFIQFQSEPSFGSWVTMTKKDGLTQMVNVGVDGERDGPFRVQRLIEQFGTGPADYQYLITVRVSWLDIMPGVETDATAYRTLDVMLSCRRLQ